MTLADGTVEYTLGGAPVIGRVFSWTVDELDAALAGSVSEVVFDTAGRVDLETLLQSVPDTEFDQSEVRRILQGHNEPENWRVGEALAETYLVHYRACHFPWP